MLDPKILGTYNMVDRSKQYTRADNPELLRSLNESWSKIRSLQTQLTQKDHAIAQIRSDLKRTQIANIALTSIITGLAWEGLKMLINVLR